MGNSGKAQKVNIRLLKGRGSQIMPDHIPRAGGGAFSLSPQWTWVGLCVCVFVFVCVCVFVFVCVCVCLREWFSTDFALGPKLNQVVSVAIQYSHCNSLGQKAIWKTIFNALLIFIVPIIWQGNNSRTFFIVNNSIWPIFSMKNVKLTKINKIC
jgi:hypothetical protein